MSSNQRRPKKEDGRFGSQITDKVGEHPKFRTRDTSKGRSIKEMEAVNRNEERKDYPEVTPTAMSNFICDFCGKNFQNQHDLVHHQRFEGKAGSNND
jgi:hypothetical protein